MHSYCIEHRVVCYLSISVSTNLQETGIRAAGVFSGDIGEMWRGDSGKGSPMASLAVNEAHRNAYRAAHENTPAALMPSPANRLLRLNCCAWNGEYTVFLAIYRKSRYNKKACENISRCMSGQ